MDPKTDAAAAAPAAAGDKQDFEGAFSEFAKAKTDPDSAPSSDSTPAATPAAGADTTAPAAGQDEPKKGELSAAADPANPAAAGEPAAGVAAPAAASAADDLWKDAPQALRDAHDRAIADERSKREAAEQKAKSAEGRYKAANSKAAELERKLGPGAASAAEPAARPAAAPAAASAAAPAAAAAAKPAPASAEPAAQTPAAEMMPWKQLQETLPDVAKAVEARFGAVDKAVKEALAAVRPVQEAEVVRFQREQGTLLDEAYSGWRDAVKKPEFTNWLKQQPQAVQALAVSDYAADNAALLEYYGYTPTKTNKEPPAPAGDGEKSAAQIAADREARLARNTAVRGDHAAPLVDAPNDYEAAFSFYARKRQDSSRRAA